MKKYLTILFILFTLNLSAATYYVAKTGNNGNLGTIGSPWLTISYAETQAIAGDVVYVRTGTYNEQAGFWHHDGTSGNHIIFQAYPGEHPIISGSGITLGAGSGIVMIYSAYLDFNGFEIVNSNETGLTISGPGCTISNCIVHEILGGGIGAYSDADNTIIEYCTVYNCSMSNSDNIMQPGEYWGEAIDIRGASGVELIEHCIVRHCIVHDHHGEGIGVIFGNDITIEDNIVYDVYAPSLYSRNSRYCLWQRNFVYLTTLMGDGTSDGIAIWDEGDDAYKNANDTFINNIIYGCLINCALAATPNILIENNTFVNARGSINFDTWSGTTYSGCHVENNIIIQEDGSSCINVASGSGITFSHNLYNKTYDADAHGTGDKTTTTHILKTGTYSDTSYYELASSSGAVNGGTDINVDYDYLSVARDATPDIGALEYVEPGSPIDPVVIYTNSVTASTTTATTGGNVIDDGGGTVTARGVAYGSSANPTIAGSHTSNGTGTGTFVSLITGLVANTTYHVRAYATNEVGTAYGADIEFTTTSETGLSGDFVFSTDKAVFVKVGTIWYQVIK